MSENSEQKTRVHVPLENIERYLREETYPDTKGEKANFRRGSKKFEILNGIFTYQGTWMVIVDTKSRIDIIRDIHKGSGDDVKARALSSHFGRNATWDKILQRFYWYTIYEDVDGFIKQCADCQKQATLPHNCLTLHSVPVPTDVMKLKLTDTIHLLLRLIAFRSGLRQSL